MINKLINTSKQIRKRDKYTKLYNILILNKWNNILVINK